MQGAVVGGARPHRRGIDTAPHDLRVRRAPWTNRGWIRGGRVMVRPMGPPIGKIHRSGARIHPSDRGSGVSDTISSSKQEG
jgi:hypothetical protein